MKIPRGHIDSTQHSCLQMQISNDAFVGYQIVMYLYKYMATFKNFRGHINPLNVLPIQQVYLNKRYPDGQEPTGCWMNNAYHYLIITWL